MKVFKNHKILCSAVVLALNVFSLSNCSKKEESSLHRFIDQLSQENVIASPLKDLTVNPQGFKKRNPALFELADKFPLEDSGTGDNPFFIKKKLQIGLVDINALLAPPASNFKFSVKIPEKSFLEFTYGIKRDSEFSPSAERARRARFRIVLEIKKRRIELFKNTLSLTNPEIPLVFDYKKIDLSDYGGEKGNFYFLTKGNEKALACWFNPLIYRPEEKGTNIILISLDTLRADHLGCYGYPNETSPNIDILAQDSVLFSNTFAPSPWTLPSHISLMTSLNTINHQVYYKKQKMESSITTLADFLRIKGFITAALTGGGFVSGIFGLNKGFDSYHVRGRITAKDSASIVCQAALDWIEKNKDRDFFLFLHTYQIHSPYFSPHPYNEIFLQDNAKYKDIDINELGLGREHRFKPVDEALSQNIIDLYDGGIRYTDEHLIQPLIVKLKESKLYDSTMIVLTSDHGEEFYEHRAWVHTHSVYNEVIKIPLIIKFFNSKHAGMKIESFARLIDVMPTILDELNIDYSDYFIEGESLLGLIKEMTDKKRKAERVFISDLASNVENLHIPKKITINQGRYKLIINENYSSTDLSYFLTPPPPLLEIEVYDLEKDPDEQKNIVLENPEIARKLIDFMNSHYKKKRKGGAKRTKMSDEVSQQLKALGYIK